MRKTKLGPLLRSTITRLADESIRGRMVYLATSSTRSRTNKAELPVIVQLEQQLPEPGEIWEEYAERIEKRLAPLQEKIEHCFGKTPTPLLASGGMSIRLATEEIQELESDPDVELMELDPIVKLVALDDAQKDIGLVEFRDTHPELTGRGVKVAVLDTGIDRYHPALKVSIQESVVEEDVSIPGRHGTLCAGILASKDKFFPGVAPDVKLIDIKVLNADGTGKHSSVIKGIDLAMLKYKPHVLSISISMNHIPTSFYGGHGWSCPDGRCPLCQAIESVVSLNRGAPVVVVAAGNVHQTAESLRRLRGKKEGFLGPDYRVDTEICCPGQASGAITVGALTKTSFLPAEFSSHGPTAFKTPKPDISAPGVNITSTIPLPRTLMGEPVAVRKGQQDSLFGRESGTSLSTPFVAGAVALIIQRKMIAGESWTPASIKKELLTQYTEPMDYDTTIVGRGRLRLNGTKMV